jgi:hypothetical protein
MAHQSLCLLVAGVGVLVVPRLWSALKESGGINWSWFKRWVPRPVKPTPAAKRARAIAAFDTLHELLPQCQDILHTAIWPQIGVIDRPAASVPQNTYAVTGVVIPVPEAKP